MSQPPTEAQRELAKLILLRIPWLLGMMPDPWPTDEQIKAAHAYSLVDELAMLIAEETR